MRNLLNRSIPRTWVRTSLLILGGLFCLSLGFSVAGLQYLSRDLPSPASIQSIKPSLKTLVFAADGDTLKEFFHENRTVVPLSRIPRRLQEAVIATEDRRFYEHYGIDPKRILKIVWVNLTSQSRPGASTLTQQLARNLFLTPEKTIVRKLKEIILALQIEQTYTKDEILTMYLNEICFGRGAYGVQAAAHTFFRKDVWDLDDGECTLLAGIIQRPESYSPIRHLEAAYRRRGVVLESMVHYGARRPPPSVRARSRSWIPTRSAAIPASPPTSSRKCARRSSASTAATASTIVGCGSGPPWCPAISAGWKRQPRITW
jgi:penicillin-binding protein 1A